MNDSRLLVAIPSLYNPANYGRFSVCFLSPGVSYPPVSTVDFSRSSIPTVGRDEEVRCSPAPQIKMLGRIDRIGVAHVLLFLLEVKPTYMGPNSFLALIFDEC